MLEDLITAGVEIEGTDQCCDHCNAPGMGVKASWIRMWEFTVSIWGSNPINGDIPQMVNLSWKNPSINR